MEVNYKKNKIELEEEGYSSLTDIFSINEVSQILNCIESTEPKGQLFIKINKLFVIRQLNKSIPEIADLIFNDKLIELISHLYKKECILTKAIYFDRPYDMNLFAAYHQDLRISVEKKADLKNYINWTLKRGQYEVQPPVQILKDTITIRIHLDDSEEYNGALRVMPKSHLHGVIRTTSKHWDLKNEQICKVKKGGVMLMKPLTLHASSKTTNKMKRRVIHLEFNKHKLSKPLNWSGEYEIKLRDKKDHGTVNEKVL